MASDITAGRLEPDKDVAAGIKAVYFINYTKGLESSATFDTDGQITAFGSPLTLFEFITRGSQDAFDENGQTSRDNGTTFVETSGTIVLRVQDIATRKQLQLAQAGRPHIITADYNGTYKFYGLENGCDISVTANGGAGMGDLYGYTISVTAQETDFANFVLASIIDDTTNTTVTVGT